MAVRIGNYFGFVSALIEYNMVHGAAVTVEKTDAMSGISKIAVNDSSTALILDHFRFEKCQTNATDGGQIEVEKHTFFGHKDLIDSRGRMKMGKQCTKAPNVSIYAHNHCLDVNGLKKGYKSKPFQQETMYGSELV